MAEQFLVSARKYRPQTFDTVVGQEHITTTLKNAIRHDQLAHAYLFCGPRGVGKTTCARILAKTLNCEHRTPDTEACGVCENCRAFDANASFNVFELDAASNNSVDDIRELVAQVRFAPQQGRFKVYIIDEVHMLSTAAFNAFLKTLEEPPPYAIFILATTEKHKILPTILSRCQIFDFKRIKTSDTVAHLETITQKEGIPAEEEALHVIAQKSEGCMRDALSMLDRISAFTDGKLTYAATLEHLAMLDAAFYFRITDCMLAADMPAALMQFEEAVARGFEGDAVLSGLAEHFRNLLLCRDERMARLLDVPANTRLQFFEKARQATPSFLMNGLTLLHQAGLEYRVATNKRIHVEVTLIRLTYSWYPEPAGPPAEAATPKKNSSPSVTPAAVPPVAAIPPPVLPTPVRPEAPIQPPVAPPPVVQPIPEKPIAVPVPQPPLPITAPTPDRPTSSRRRISADLLTKVTETGANQYAAKPVVPLEPDTLNDVFAQFGEQLRANNEHTLYAQFSQLQIQKIGDSEVEISCPTEMAEVYVKNTRDRLLDFFQKQYGRVIRVLTRVVVDDSLPKPPKQLSKQEMYEELVRENPLLQTLRNTLGLQIDY
ncbi:MAG: DNA polymerase III subunit gamma/tau [Sphingobacteriales bacterium]|nr:MAG: DNA polymerase III subunit gamma/tau [Sphingobacteriales bacterium]